MILEEGELLEVREGGDLFREKLGGEGVFFLMVF